MNFTSTVKTFANHRNTYLFLTWGFISRIIFLRMLFIKFEFDANCYPTQPKATTKS